MIKFRATDREKTVPSIGLVIFANVVGFYFHFVATAPVTAIGVRLDQIVIVPIFLRRGEIAARCATRARFFLLFRRHVQFTTFGSKFKVYWSLPRSSGKRVAPETMGRLKGATSASAVKLVIAARR